MASDTIERKLAAILSADVVGYSRLMAEDEDATVRTLTAYREQIASSVREHRGRVVDSPGDNLLAEFPTATDAVTCAVEVQGVLKVRNAPLPADRRMEFRIGLHLGEVRVEGERIYGDGVNIAARLEGLAEAGGICISRAVHEQVQHRVELIYQDLGDQDVKNIPEPVRVYRVQTASAAPTASVPRWPMQRGALAALAVVLLAVAAFWAVREHLPAELIAALVAPTAPHAVDEQYTVAGFGGRPAIAVLAFDNLSGDPEQEYFADGIAEDLITRLSTSSGFPVIARNSTFTYKGHAVDVQQVGRELGARYVVEGSVRKSGARVRISAQLIDAATGHHVWAETYDRELRDIFAVQDEITEAIVGSINPAIIGAEWRRVARKDPRDLGVYDLEMQGWWRFGKLTREENLRARSLFERTIELGPQSSAGFTGLAFTHWNAVAFQWTDTPAETISAMKQAARRSVELDANNALAHTALSLAYVSAGQLDEAIAAAEHAVDLDPSSSIGHAWLGGFLAGRGRLEEALASAEKAIRLSPRDPMLWFLFSQLSTVHFAAHRYDDAAEWARRSIRANPKFPYSRAMLAASYAHLDRLDDARAEVEGLLRVQPGFSLAFAEERTLFVSLYRARYLDGLRKAGLPE